MSVTNSLGYTVKAGAFSSGKFEAKINDIDINELSDNVTALQTDVKTLTSGDIATLQTNVSTLQSDVSALQSATLTVSLTSGTTYTFPETVVQEKQIFVINTQAATDVTVATTYTDATSSLILTPGDKLTARGGTVSSGAMWLIGI